MDTDIKNIQEILRLEGREDLAKLLNNSKSFVNQSNQYGTYAFSVISTFEIHSPVRECLTLKKLSNDDKKIIFDSVLNIYPPRDSEPEIVDIEYLILRSEIIDKQEIDQSNLPNNSTPNSFPTLKIFVSYSTEEKKLAGVFGDKLREMGFDVFLAHEDIQPSKEWVDEILNNLNKSDIFLPIITNNFKQSNWTDQECGIAFSKNLKIIPVHVQLHPYGFIGKYQSLTLKTIDIPGIMVACNQILEMLEADETYSKKMRGFYVGRFINSASFNQTRKYLRKIISITDLTNEEAHQVLTASITNDQISGARHYDHSTALGLKSIADKFQSRIGNELLKQFNAKFGYTGDSAL